MKKPERLKERDEVLKYLKTDKASGQWSVGSRRYLINDINL